MKARDIIGVCSGKNESLVREHGATDVIDYTKVIISVKLSLLLSAQCPYVTNYRVILLPTLLIKKEMFLTMTSLTWCMMLVLLVGQVKIIKTR